MHSASEWPPNPALQLSAIVRQQGVHMKLKVMLFVFSVLLFPVTSLAEPNTRWTLSSNPSSTKSQPIGEAAERLKLKSEWACTIAKVSYGAGYQARQTQCKKGQEEIEFSTQCGEKGPKDHTQVRFRDPQTEKLLDFIEVSCVYEDVGR